MSQHTIFFLSIVLKRIKVKWQCRFFFFKIEHGLFRVIGLKLVGEPPPVFVFFIFPLLPFIVPPYSKVDICSSSFNHITWAHYTKAVLCCFWQVSRVHSRDIFAGGQEKWADKYMKQTIKSQQLKQFNSFVIHLSSCWKYWT